MIKIFHILLVFAILQPAFAAKHKIIAYPVPFNHKKGDLTISEEKNFYYTDKTCSIKIDIYDISGGIVYSKKYSVFPIKWNGSDNSGKKSPPGLYIIKVKIEILQSGDIDEQYIRILIKR